jgi:hypothetical protein
MRVIYGISCPALHKARYFDSGFGGPDHAESMFVHESYIFRIFYDDAETVKAADISLE